MRIPQVSERIKEAPAQALRSVFAGIGQLLLITDKLRNKTPADADGPQARVPETVPDAAAAGPARQREEAAEPAPAEPVATEPAPAESAADESAPAEPAPAEPAPAEPVPAESARAEAAPAKAARTARTRAQAPAASGAPAVPMPPKPQKARDFDKTGNVRLIGGEEGGEAAAPAATASPEAAPGPEAAVVSPATPDDAVALDSVTVPAATAPEAVPSDLAPPLPNYDGLSVASLRARLRNLDAAQVRGLAEYERAHAARADVIVMFERRIAKLEAEA